MNTFVKTFRFRRSARYGVATYVHARNGGNSQFKRLTGPMSYGEAVYQAERIARKGLNPGSAVTLPAAKHGEKEEA